MIHQKPFLIEDHPKQQEQAERALISRLGCWIGWQRRKAHRITKDPQYSQKEFLKTTYDCRFYGLTQGVEICSRMTLARVENGLSIRDPNLLSFFMCKLGHFQQFEDHTMFNLNQLIEGLVRSKDFNQRYEVHLLRRQLIQLKREKLNVLSILDIKWMLIYLDWLEDRSVLSPRNFDDLLECLACLSPLIRQYCKNMLVFKVYFNANYWMNSDHILHLIQKTCQHDEILIWGKAVFHTSIKGVSFSFKNTVLPLSIIKKLSLYQSLHFQSEYEFQLFKREKAKLILHHPRLVFEPYPFQQSQLILSEKEARSRSLIPIKM